MQSAHSIEPLALDARSFAADWLLLFGSRKFNNPSINIFGADFAAVMMKNFLNRGAATFFKDVTTVGALLMPFVYGAGGLSIARRAGIAQVPLPIRR